MYVHRWLLYTRWFQSVKLYCIIKSLTFLFVRASSQAQLPLPVLQLIFQTCSSIDLYSPMNGLFCNAKYTKILKCKGRTFFMNFKIVTTTNAGKPQIAIRFRGTIYANTCYLLNDKKSLTFCRKPLSYGFVNLILVKLSPE